MIVIALLAGITSRSSISCRIAGVTTAIIELAQRWLMNFGGLLSV